MHDMLNINRIMYDTTQHIMHDMPAELWKRIILENLHKQKDPRPRARIFCIY